MKIGFGLMFPIYQVVSINNIKNNKNIYFLLTLIKKYKNALYNIFSYFNIILHILID